jgi:hypothetical protein
MTSSPRAVPLFLAARSPDTRKIRPNLLGNVIVTTRTKLFITSYTTSIMMLLIVFSKPLHISETFQGVLIVGGFIMLGLAFHFLQKQKQEEQKLHVAAGAGTLSTTERQKRARNGLVLTMVIGSVVGLCSPLWLPLTGTSLGTRGDLAVGFITAAVICTICGFRLRKI